MSETPATGENPGTEQTPTGEEPKGQPQPIYTQADADNLTNKVRATKDKEIAALNKRLSEFEEAHKTEHEKALDTARKEARKEAETEFEKERTGWKIEKGLLSSKVPKDSLPDAVAVVHGRVESGMDFEQAIAAASKLFESKDGIGALLGGEVPGGATGGVSMTEEMANRMLLEGTPEEIAKAREFLKAHNPAMKEFYS